jgi:hypothetical protein
LSPHDNSIEKFFCGVLPTLPAWRRVDPTVVVF